MRTLLDPVHCDEILCRLRDLSPDANRQWGSMSVDQMLCHTADQLRFAVGDLDAGSPSGILTNRPLRWFAIAWMPWPPRFMISTSPSLLQTGPNGFEHDVGELRGLIRRFSRKGREGRFDPHPMFGALSNALWGRLAWRHLDYHLRQFGA